TWRKRWGPTILPAAGPCVAATCAPGVSFMPHRMSVQIYWSLALGLLTCGTARAQDTAAYLDPALPLDKRVANLIGQMTLEEKAESLFHNSKGIPRLRVPAW